MNSRLVYVVGPSGAGKDSLLGWLKERLPSHLPIHWSRRTITRASGVGGENHESVDANEFERMLTKDDLGMHWFANGLHYGIRHSELEWLQKNHWVFVNGSRAHLPLAAQKFPGMVILHITASEAVLRERLILRGRESSDNIEARIQRSIQMQWPANCPRLSVFNDGLLEDSGIQLLMQLQQLRDWPFQTH